MTRPTDIPVLNGLRGFAALSVCLFHFICTVNGFIDSDFFTGIFSFGHYGVQMFFVISGFIIPWSMYHNGYKLKHYFTFAAKRFIRLEPPYLVSLMVAIAHTYIRMLSPHYNGVDITPDTTQVLLHFGYLIPFFQDQEWIRQVYWTLAIEFQYYLTIALLFPLIANGNFYLRFLSYLIMFSGVFFFKGFFPFHLPVFLFGICLFLYKANIIRWLELSILIIAAGLEVVFYHDVATLIFASVTFLVILFFTDYKNKVAVFLGEISYSVYLFHGLTGLVILNYFSHSVEHPLLKFLLVLLAILVTIVAAYLVYRFVELPSKKLSSRIKFVKNKEK
ncbi:MAG: acyltransferase [Bacteroidota bacterium]|nr:acyltransferase [Bacteroidota bacterium]